MRKLLTLLFIIPLFVTGQEKGINFEHNGNWEKIKAKAKAENKHIFVDCFTTWCGPCIWMAENVFPQENVGTFFNANFVNLKLQMDQTKKDTEEVKSWYSEATRFAKDYGVRAYPTFLIFSPNGELVHRMVGGGEAESFIARAKEGLNPETQYVTLVKKFEANPKDAAIAKSLAKAAQSAYDEAMSSKAITAFIESVGVEGALTSDNIDLLLQGATSSKSASYGIIKDNMKKVDALLEETQKPGSSNDILSSILVYELVMPKIGKAETPSVDFVALQKEIEQVHPYVDMTSSLARAKAQYYGRVKNWPAFKDAVDEFVKVGSKRLSPQDLNSFAWTIFENCDDAACITSALAWSKKSLEAGENAAYLDTYANLLYKSGDKANAIKWQEKALVAASESEKENYQAILNKMKAGEPTWD
ncbi:MULTISPECIES: thioredoxin family protein [Sphingobacterium]|uniref:thioredoxin family protein n=1 Tax=Sphingobacterium TaxID=28453 RepID=UPI0013DBBEE4|nr:MULTISPECIES: thioredoxin fold domain-containing protein [unclassified Sphingobacterium]